MEQRIPTSPRIKVKALLENMQILYQNNDISLIQRTELVNSIKQYGQNGNNEEELTERIKQLRFCSPLQFVYDNMLQIINNQ